MRRGHRLVFFERDVPYYAQHRDYTLLPGGGLVLYRSWEEVAGARAAELADADARLVTSYCPDAMAAGEAGAFVRCGGAGLLRSRYAGYAGQSSRRPQRDYIGPRGWPDFDLVLSYTGGAALSELKTRLGARRAAPLYGSVDPAVHFPVPPRDEYRALSPISAPMRRTGRRRSSELFLEPARRLARPQRFLIGGSMYPRDSPWTRTSLRPRTCRRPSTRHSTARRA